MKPAISTADIFREYEDLFSREAVAAIETEHDAAQATGDEEATLRLRLLRESATLGHLANRNRELREKAFNFEAAAKVTLPGGETLPYRASAVRLMNESDREKRNQLEEARQKVVEEKNRFLEPHHKTTHREAVVLGYGSYLEMLGRLKSYSLEPIRDTMRTFLDETETLYEREMGRALESIGAQPDSARRHDATYLMKGGRYDHLFPLDKMVEAVDVSVRRMGLNLSANGRIRLDLEERPTKSPRAFCAPIRVPAEVMLVIFPRGGMDDYHAFLHELGHALHFAWVRPDAPYEYAHLGDNSVTEGFAMLFDHLLLNERWLHESLRIRNTGALLHHAYLAELYMLRRYAAKIDYELVLHESADLEEKPAIYAKKLSRANRVSYSPVHYLDDVDPHFYCANYLRAWMLQAALAAELADRFGESWYHDPRSGELLKELWAFGQRENAEGILAQLTGDTGSLQPALLLRAIEQHLAG